MSKIITHRDALGVRIDIGDLIFYCRRMENNAVRQMFLTITRQTDKTLFGFTNWLDNDSTYRGFYASMGAELTAGAGEEARSIAPHTRINITKMKPVNEDLNQPLGEDSIGNMVYMGSRVLIAVPQVASNIFRGTVIGATEHQFKIQTLAAPPRTYNNRAVKTVKPRNKTIVLRPGMTMPTGGSNG